MCRHFSRRRKFSLPTPSPIPSVWVTSNLPHELLMSMVGLNRMNRLMVRQLARPHALNTREQFPLVGNSMYVPQSKTICKICCKAKFSTSFTLICKTMKPWHIVWLACSIFCCMRVIFTHKSTKWELTAAWGHTQEIQTSVQCSGPLFRFVGPV